MIYMCVFINSHFISFYDGMLRRHEHDHTHGFPTQIPNLEFACIPLVDAFSWSESSERERERVKAWSLHETSNLP
jgi:hypothetical protein